MGKLGIVIFDDDYSALQWANASLLPEFQLVRILFAKVVQGQTTTTAGPKKYEKDKLSGLVEGNKELENNKSYREDIIRLFDNCQGKFPTKDFYGIYYKGGSIQEILKKALEDFQLDTLVLGMSALGNTGIDLQLNSACSVVLAKMDPQPLTLKTTFEKMNSAAPAADAPATTVKKNEAGTSGKK